MAVKKFKPTSPGRRFQTGFDFSEITVASPEKRLVRSLKKSGGRNATGRMTSRHRGGGHKRRFRLIDFRRIKDGVPGRIATIEYDPNRSARIALVVYADGDKRYIVAPADINVGDRIDAGVGSDIKPGSGRNGCPQHRAQEGRWCSVGA